MAVGMSPCPAAAQGAGSATLRGTVADASGGLLPTASVILVNQRTKLTRSATADGRGEYVLSALTPGAYRVQVGLQGFALWKSGEVHLGPGDSRAPRRAPACTSDGQPPPGRRGTHPKRRPTSWRPSSRCSSITIGRNESVGAIASAGSYVSLKERTAFVETIDGLVTSREMVKAGPDLD